MRNKGLNIFFAVASIVLPALCVLPALAQSNNQNFPTPVTTNEISGTIKARDIGDSRLTTYFYTFNGTQGDIFINVITKNFNGDIDIFAVEGFKALTKVVVYADTSANETGRLIYLRKPEKLLLRVEGRSPNDEPATFRIKFAGSFVAAEHGADTDASEMPEVKSVNDSDVIVNSVGTIIGVKPKPTPTPAATVAKVVPPVKKETPPTDRDDAADEEEKLKDKPIKVLISENIPPAKKIETPKKEVEPPVGRRVRPPVKKTEPATEGKDTTGDDKADDASDNTADSKTTPAQRTGRKPKTTTPPAPNPLESIMLIVLFKDGKKIERPMSEVLRFNVDKGILTVVLKDGTMSKHSILDVEKVTIE